MTVTVFGNGTVTGISAGGLPDGCIQSADIASGVISPAGLLEYSRGAKNGSITVSSTTPVDVGIRANLNPTSTGDIIRFHHFWGHADATSGTAQAISFWKSLNGGTFTEHLKWVDYINHWASGATNRTTTSLWWEGTANDLGWSTGVLSLGVKIALQNSNTWVYNDEFGASAYSSAKQLSFVEAFRYSASSYTAGTDA